MIFRLKDKDIYKYLLAYTYIAIFILTIGSISNTVIHPSNDVLATFK
jgi:hypothetical protein